MFPRHAAASVLEALSDRPVVFIHGPRQAGKTTLVRAIARGPHRARYLTLDDAGVLSAALADPEGFLAGLEGPVVLDEVQRAPELFLPLKASVDRDRQPGRFLLTGSTDALLLPRLSRALVGRVEVLTLWPLSQGEIGGAEEEFVDALFKSENPSLVASPGRGEDPIPRILRGGFPEVARKKSGRRRGAWFGSYLTTVLQRDVRDMASIEGLSSLPRLLRLIASRPMAFLNYADLSRMAGLPQTTLKRYLALLQATFVVREIPPWFSNLGKRIAKRPKVAFSDTGLMAHLLGANARRLRSDRGQLGGLLENFVVMEVAKQIGWSRSRPEMFHFRAHDGTEVDIVLEHPSGKLVGIEVKASATAASSHFKGLKRFAEAVGDRFHRGLVLYTGQEVIPFGKRLHAMPISSLWRWGAKAPAGRRRRR